MPQSLKDLHVDEADTPDIETREAAEALADMGKDMPCANDTGKLGEEVGKGEASVRLSKTPQKVNPILTPDIVSQNEASETSAVVQL